MFNTEKPNLSELPSSRQLLKSTVLALLTAFILLFTVILPAEYGVDVTGAGRVLGLTEMGEIKNELEDELKKDSKQHSNLDNPSFLQKWLKFDFVGKAYAKDSWQDQITFTLAPGEYKEIKMPLKTGGTVAYEWQGQGGRINYDLHAHGNGQSVTYEKGRGKTEGEGNFTAPFEGNHGWFWRNRDSKDVTVTLSLRGDYQTILTD